MTKKLNIWKLGIQIDAGVSYCSVEWLCQAHFNTQLGKVSKAILQHTAMKDTLNNTNAQLEKASKAILQYAEKTPNAILQQS